MRALVLVLLAVVACGVPEGLDEATAPVVPDAGTHVIPLHSDAPCGGTVRWVWFAQANGARLIAVCDEATAGNE